MVIGTRRRTFLSRARRARASLGGVEGPTGKPVSHHEPGDRTDCAPPARSKVAVATAYTDAANRRLEELLLGFRHERRGRLNASTSPNSAAPLAKSEADIIELCDTAVANAPDGRVADLVRGPQDVPRRGPTAREASRDPGGGRARRPRSGWRCGSSARAVGIAGHGRMLEHAEPAPAASVRSIEGQDGG